MTAERREQIEIALSATAELREQGWGRVTVAVTPGGTIRIEAEAEGAKVARPQFGSGLKRWSEAPTKSGTRPDRSAT